MNRQRFAVEVLAGLGIAPTGENVRALKGWQRAEGGHWNNTAEHNPLNTTLNLPGSGDTGSQGNISVYRDWRQGVKATVKTLELPAYAGIRRALRGGSAMRVARAIDSSPWGTHGQLVYQTIAGAKAPGRVPQPRGLAGGGSSGGGSVSVQAPGTPGTSVEPGDSSGVLSLLGELTAPRPVSASAPAAPAFTARAVLPEGAATVAPSGGGGVPQLDVGSVLDAVRTSAGSIPQAARPGAVTDVAAGGSGAASAGRSGAGVDLRPRGGYKGAKGPATQLARIGFSNGLRVMSTKRHNTNPYSGSRSDHDYGNTDAFAYDLSNGNRPTPQMDETALQIMRALGDRKYKKGEPIDTSRGVFNIKTKGGAVRVQVIYRGSGAAFGGDHTNHVHVGVKRVA